MSKKTVKIGGVTASQMADRGVDGEQLYWRIRGPGPARQTLWTGWATPTEIELVAARLVAAGIPSRPERRAAGPVRTVDDLVVAWAGAQAARREASEIAERTLAAYQGAVRHWRSSRLADVRVELVTRAQVRDQATAWLRAGVAPRTVDFAARVLVQAWIWGAERGLVRELDLTTPQLARDDEHVYTGRVPLRTEIQAVIARIRPGPRRDAIEVLSLTGARVGEVTALLVRDVDLVREQLRLTGSDERIDRRGKVRPRQFPLRGRLLELIRELVRDRQPSDRLLDLPRSGSHLLHTELVRASAAAGVEPVTPHGIRRTVVAELLEVADPKTVSELTGHSVVTLLKRYVRPTRARLAETLDRAGLDRVHGVVVTFPGTGNGHDR